MIGYLLYVLLGQGVLYLAYQLWLKHDTNYHWNRLCLLVGIVLPFILPALRGTAFDASKEAVPAFQLPAMEVSLEQVEQSYGSELIDIPATLWITGAVISFLLLLYQLYSVAKIIRTSPKREYGEYMIVSVPEHIPTCSIFKYILWPESQKIDESNQAMLQHELAHVKEWHTLDVFFLGILKCILWMNPFLYLYEKELRTQHEFAADRYALSHTSSDQYIRLLGQSVLSQANLVYAHSFYSSNLKSRIDMIKSWNQTPISWKKVAGAFAFAGLLSLGMALYRECLSEDETSIESEIATQEQMEVVEVIDDNSLQPATIKGGMQELYAQLGEKLKYPKAAVDAGVEGKVMVSFTVNTDGTMSDFKVLRGIGHGCDEAAVAALEASGTLWEPAVKDGKVVSQNMVLPISFKI